jgi:hypothetical protein
VDLRALKQAAATDRPAPEALPTLADLAARADGTDWPGLIADRFGVWASGYFDRGQALWAAPRGKSAWAAFRAHASNDLTPEILGLTGFAAFVADMPEDPVQAIAEAVAPHAPRKLPAIEPALRLSGLEPFESAPGESVTGEAA